MGLECGTALRFMKDLDIDTTFARLEGLFVIGTIASLLFILRTDKVLCIRRIAGPLSSVAKSNPRWTERRPVAISVRLAERDTEDC